MYSEDATMCLVEVCVPLEVGETQGCILSTKLPMCAREC
jgi:hypothetical protein